MNPQMPYFAQAPPPPPPPPPGQMTSANYYHNGYPPMPRWSEMNNAQNRNNWKSHRNWQQKFNRDQTAPYNIPKKNFKPRFPRNSNPNFYDINGHQANWGAQKKAQTPKNSEDKEMEQNIPGVIANKKKRKPMSKSYPSNKWDEKDAEKALQAEKDFVKNLKKQSLIIRFPDPDLSKEIVQKFHPLIESVHFPHASTPRYCFAHLDETADIDEVVKALEKIPFGQGFLSVDIKKPREEVSEFSPKDIDPYTLYVGNLPLNVTKQGVIQQFPGCTRIDIGHPQQLKNTRYAFVRFANVDDSIRAYKNTRNTQFESRSLIVRFRRINGNVGVPGESKQVNKPKSENPQDPISSSSTTPKPIECLSETASICSTVSSTFISQVPDLNLVKEEPTSDSEDTSDQKPNFFAYNEFSDMIKREIKMEDEQNRTNEDEVEHNEDDEDYVHDNFQYNEDPNPELEDDIESEEDVAGYDLNLNDTFLPCDDDGDF